MSKEISVGSVVDVVSPREDQWQRDIDRMQQLDGIDHIELWVEHIPSDRQTSLLQVELGSTPLTVHGPFGDMNLVTPIEAIGNASYERISQALSVSALLEAKVFTIHAGKYMDYAPYQDALKMFAERYLNLYAQGKKEGVEVAVENIGAKTGVARETVATLSSLRKLKQIIPEVRFTADVAHTVQNGEDPEVLLDEFEESIASIHIHDAVEGQQSHRCIGRGDLNLDAVVRKINQYKFPYVTLELLSYEDTVESLQLLRQSLAKVS